MEANTDRPWTDTVWNGGRSYWKASSSTDCSAREEYKQEAEEEE